MEVEGVLWVGAGPFGLDMKGGPGTARRKSLWSLTGAGPAPSPRGTTLPAPCGDCVCSLCCVTFVPREGNTGKRGKV